MSGESYFDQDSLAKMVGELEKSPQAPDWLPGALRLLGQERDSLPLSQERSLPAVEFIYPH